MHLPFIASMPDESVLRSISGFFQSKLKGAFFFKTSANFEFCKDRKVAHALLINIVNETLTKSSLKHH